MRIYTFFVLIFFVTNIYSQNEEFRGAWITTVFNTDWPSKSGLSSEDQQKELIDILDQHHARGINAIIFQVRTTSDALYASELEPWSQWLSGKQGVPPNPYYDPLKFIIDQAHKRDMELHAWLNPYRAEINEARNASAPNQISQKHPEWCISYGIRNYLDPGIPEVQSHIIRIVKDIIMRYEVDGIHFDDYFYPYKRKGEEFNDSKSFAKYGSGFKERDDWRRDNVSKIVKMLSDTISAYKPNVKFGISPFGIWRNLHQDTRGSATRGMTNYDDLYADVLLWMDNKWIDYVMPQLYWPIGDNVADFKTLIEWWGRHANGRHVYAGIGLYNAGNKSSNALWRDPKQLEEQLNLVRSTDHVDGLCFYSSVSFKQNPLNIENVLRNKYFKKPVHTPLMPWKINIPVLTADTLPSVVGVETLPTIKPVETLRIEAPQALRITRQKNEAYFSWEPSINADEFESVHYQVYRLRDRDTIDIRQGDLYTETSNTSFLIQRKKHVWFRRSYYFVVIAVAENLQSTPSNTAKLRLKYNELTPLDLPSMIIR